MPDPSEPIHYETAMSDEFNQGTGSRPSMQHQAASAYSLRLPDRARTLIPPVRTYPEGRKQIWSANLGKITSVYSTDPSLDFLNTEGLNDWITRSVGESYSWDYSQRRHAQKVLPFMHIGPLAVLKAQDFLVEEGITMVLAVYPDSKLSRLTAEGSVRIPRAMGLEINQYFATTPLQLVQLFDTTNSAVDNHFINQHKLQQPGKVLFCCESGNVQSSAVLVAWLVAHLTDLTVIQAIQLVATQRMSCGFDESLKHALTDYAGLLKAKKDVFAAQYIAAGSIAPPGQHPISKRSRNMDDEDEDMQDADDMLRFDGRTSMPFLPTG